MIKSIDSIMFNISQLNEKNAKVNTALSSGEALEYGSDDSITYSYILNIKNDINTYESIEENITLSDAYNTTSDDTIASIKSTTEAIISELIKANTDTSNDEDRLIIAEQIESYKDLLLSSANTDVDGQYIFSGINTDVQPFAQNADGSISYQSDNSVKRVNVEENTYAQQGANGIDIFYQTTAEVSSGQKYEQGDSFTFDATESIVDEDGNTWQLVDTDSDSVFDGLYMNGDILTTPIPVTDNGDGTITTTNNVSDLVLNRSGDGDSFTFNDNNIIMDENGNIWQLTDSDSDGTFDSLYLNGDTSTTPISVTDNGDGTFSASNTSTVDLEVKESLFDSLDRVIAALKLEDLDGNTISSEDARSVISDTLDEVKDAYDTQNVAHALVGNRTSTIATYDDVISSKLTNLSILEEKYASADLTELAVQAKALENTYEALYTSINRVYSMSLVNYIQ